MKERFLDMRGKPCPEPVVETRKALDEPDVTSVTVILDDESACENVGRMAQHLGCELKLEEGDAGSIHLIITKGETPIEPRKPVEAPEPAARSESPDVIVLVGSSTLGSGDEALGAVLMRAFLKTLKEALPLPSAVIFLNSGVRLTTEGSELISDIEDLYVSGVRILSCGTCLDFFHIKEKLEVGSVTNMLEIVSLLLSSDKTIRI